MTHFFRFAICLTAFCLTSLFGFAGVHPTPVDEKTNCLECHADKAAGYRVHAAVKQGCKTCHSIENRAGITEINLNRPTPAGCFQCHQQARFAYPHFSYASGDCTRCHDPHASANVRLLRLKVNELCLTCHLRTGETVPSPYLPTIVLTSANRVGHPFIRHPVSGKIDPLTGSEMSCISCHLAHGGAKLHHLKMGSQIPEDVMNETTETNDMCNKCHAELWGLDRTSRKKATKH